MVFMKLCREKKSKNRVVITHKHAKQKKEQEHTRVNYVPNIDGVSKPSDAAAKSE
jgi:hypothetical protein